MALKLVRKISGCRYWFNKEGLNHARSRPASLYRDGSKTWFLNGEIDRVDNKPKIIMISHPENPLLTFMAENNRRGHMGLPLLSS